MYHFSGLYVVCVWMRRVVSLFVFATLEMLNISLKKQNILDRYRFPTKFTVKKEFEIKWNFFVFVFAESWQQI